MWKKIKKSLVKEVSNRGNDKFSPIRRGATMASPPIALSSSSIYHAATALEADL
jgi:hypothetical protein